MLEAGIDGLIMLGTVGENCSLEPEEKLEVLRATVAWRRGASAGAGRRGRNSSTAGACRFAAAVQEVGVDGMTSPPAASSMQLGAA